jgi:AcrR family transcriptional regulator
MTARARAVEATRTSILDAIVELSTERLLTEIGLDDVADRAGVSVQTVLRHFGNRDGLIDAGVLHAQQSVVEERRTPHGEVELAVRVIVDHYEQRGRAVLLLLAQEPTDPRVARITDDGRALHRAWVEEVFAPLLPAEESERAAGVDLLVVATDVYARKLLRLDRGLTRVQAQQRIERLVRAVLTDLGETGRTHS